MPAPPLLSLERKCWCGTAAPCVGSPAAVGGKGGQGVSLRQHAASCKCRCPWIAFACKVARFWCFTSALHGSGPSNSQEAVRGSTPPSQYYSQTPPYLTHHASQPALRHLLCHCCVVPQHRSADSHEMTQSDPCLLPRLLLEWRMQSDPSLLYSHRPAPHPVPPALRLLGHGAAPPYRQPRGGLGLCRPH